MEVEAAKMIGAGLAVIALAGVGVGIGNIFSALVTSIARNPAARSEVFGIGILGFALGVVAAPPPPRHFSFRLRHGFDLHLGAVARHRT